MKNFNLRDGNQARCRGYPREPGALSELIGAMPLAFATERPPLFDPPTGAHVVV